MEGMAALISDAKYSSNDRPHAEREEDKEDKSQSEASQV